MASGPGPQWGGISRPSQSAVGVSSLMASTPTAAMSHRASPSSFSFSLSPHGSFSAPGRHAIDSASSSGYS